MNSKRNKLSAKTFFFMSLHLAYCENIRASACKKAGKKRKV